MKPNQKKPRKQLVDVFTELAVSTALRPFEFRKSRRRFWRERGPVFHLFDVQSSTWNEGTTATVTINCGIDVKGCFEIIQGGPPPKIPVVSAAVVQARLGHLAPRSSPDFGDVWWTISYAMNQSDWDVIEREVRRRIEDDAMPWFQKFQTEHDVAEYLIRPEWGPGLGRTSYKETPQSHVDLRNAAACFAICGDVDRALELLDLAIRESQGRRQELDDAMVRRLRALKG